MKKIFLIGVLLSCGYAFGFSQCTPPPPPPPALMKGSPSTYEANLKPNSIELFFLQTLGNVVITAKSSSAMVYTNVVNATTGSKLVVDTSQWPSGSYTIRMVDSKGVLMGEITVLR